MSSTHVVVRLVRDSWTLEDCGSKNGTYVNGRRLQRVELRDGDIVELGHSFFVFREGSGGDLERPLDAYAPFMTLNAASERVFERLRAVANTDAPVA